MLLVSFAFGYFCGDTLRLSEKPSEYIGLIFSILAAAIFAVIGIIGDPGMLLSGNWRVASVNARTRHAELKGFNLVFYLYLITLGLLVVSELIEAAQAEKFYFIFNVFGGFAAFSFLWSFRVPYRLRQIQKHRLEDEIAERKRPKVKNDS